MRGKSAIVFHNKNKHSAKELIEMKVLVFKSKKGTHYASFNEGIISVYLPKDFKPEYKQAKNGSEYFTAEVELYKSKKNNKYSFIVKK